MSIVRKKRRTKIGVIRISFAQRPAIVTAGLAFIDFFEESVLPTSSIKIRFVPRCIAMLQGLRRPYAQISGRAPAVVRNGLSLGIE